MPNNLNCCQTRTLKGHQATAEELCLYDLIVYLVCLFWEHAGTCEVSL